MKISFNSIDLIEKLNPIDFATYLSCTDWNLFPTKRTFLKIYQRTLPDGRNFQVNVPVDKNLSDYSNAMQEAIVTVATVENRSINQILSSISNVSKDVIRVRLESKSINAGNVNIDEAINLYENIKKLIVATAQDIIKPESYHKNMTNNKICKLIQNCQFGQTEIGSYVVPILCVFDEISNPPKQLCLFNENNVAQSLTRRVTNKLMTRITSIKKHIDNDDEDKLFIDDEGILVSANFYEALIGLNLDKEDANIEFSAQWSPVVKENRSKNNKIDISHKYYKSIFNVIRKLREMKSDTTKILGRIKKLESSPDATKRNSGKITIVYPDKNGNMKTIIANLNKEGYEKAIKAHINGNYVEVIGEIEKINSRHSSINPEIFNVIEG